MNKKHIELSLKNAVEQITPNVLDNILPHCSKQNGKVIKMKNNKKILKSVVAIAASVAIIIGGLAVLGSINKSRKDIIYSTVTLDVNPSIEISLTENESVVDVKALNDAAKVVLDGKNYKYAPLDKTVDAIIDSMVKKGYIDKFSNSILISVDSESSSDGKALEKKLNHNVEALLNTNDFSGSVLSQTVKHTDELDRIADKYAITVGKAQLINEIIAADSRYTFEQLVPLKINELNLISRSGEMLSSAINVTGTASDKKYITAEEAKRNALNYSGISEDEYSNNAWYHFFKYVNDKLIFEVSLYYNNFEYKYDVDAISGEILKSERIKDTDNPSGNKIAFKEEIFEDFGLTYDELVKKYGNETKQAWDSGALYCEFENGLGRYSFNADYEGIKGTDVCFAVRLNAKYVFNNFNETIAITDLAKAIDCEITTSFDEMHGEGYFSTFKYKEYTVMFHTTDKKLIDQNTYISFVIK